MGLSPQKFGSVLPSIASFYDRGEVISFPPSSLKGDKRRCSAGTGAARGLGDRIKHRFEPAKDEREITLSTSLVAV